MPTLLRAMRTLLATLLLALGLAAPASAQAADVFAIVDQLAALGVWPSSLPPPSTVKDVIRIYDKCGSVSGDTTLIACVEELLDNEQTSGPIGQTGSEKWVRLAIEIYLDIKNEDYVELIVDGGKPLGCALAQVLTGLDLCGAVEALIAIGGAVADVVAAFVEGLESATEWVACILGSCSGGGGGSSSTGTLAAYFLQDKFVQPGVFVRLAPTTKPWLDHLAMMRKQAETLKDERGVPIPVVTQPSATEILQAVTAFTAKVGDRWDQELQNSVLAQLEQARADYRKTKSLPQAIRIFNAPEAQRAGMVASAKVDCEENDRLGRMLSIWKSERGSIKPGHPANTKATTAEYCANVMVYVAAEDAGRARKVSLAQGCVAKDNGDDFDTFQCSKYSGLAACKKAQQELASSMGSLGTGAKLPASMCSTVAVAAGAEFAAVLAKHDPQKRCAIAAGGMSVECKRDPSVTKACAAAVKDYQTTVMGGGENAPIVNVTCVAKRDAEYQGLVAQAANAASQIAKNADLAVAAAIAAYNARPENAAYKITQTFAGSGFVSVSPEDPLLLVVSYTDPIKSIVLEAVGKVSPALSGADASDPGNDGQDKPGYRQNPQLTPAQQAFADAVKKAVEAKVNTATSGGTNPYASGGVAGAVANPVINPGATQAGIAKGVAGNPYGGAMGGPGTGLGAGVGVGVAKTNSASTADLKMLTDAGCKPVPGKPDAFSCPMGKGMDSCKKLQAEKKVSSCTG